MIIVTDSAVDMPKDEAQALGVHVAPLYIQFPEGEVSSEDLTPDDFYNRLRAMWPEIPTTAMPSIGNFADLYSKLCSLKDEILSVHISSGLSSTIESARQGAQQAHACAVHLVDTLTLSGGERFQVLFAAEAAKAGLTCEAIFERLKEIQKSSEVIFTLETLDYLAKGGRIGRVQALAGSILKLKPVINVDKVDGKYNTVSKERTMAKALENICRNLLKTYGAETPLWVTVMHGQFAEQADLLAKLLQEKMTVVQLECLRVSPVLGVHTGPGVVGAAVVPASLMQI